MDISKVFKANPVSIQMLLHEPGQCYYVPAYQRAYSWDNSNIDRLLDDIGHGASQLLEMSEALSFLGTIITIHDTQYTTVEPKVVEQLPPKVMTVVDGQQRLTSLMMLIASLHDSLTTRSVKDPEVQSAEMAWLEDRVDETYSILGKALEDDRDSGESPFYPRMVRAYDDRWSKKEKELLYESPVAQFLHSYGNQKRESLRKKYAYPSDGDQVLKSRLSRIRRLLNRSVAQGDVEGPVQFPSNQELADGVLQLGALFQGPVHKGVPSRLLSGESSDVAFCELFRVLIYSRFVLDRVAVTHVVANSEDYAFDMFEALNTTGEPLTAIETFLPRIIRSEGHSEYESSPSRQSMVAVDSYLGRFTTAPSRQSATADLLIAFRLAETGAKLSKRLTTQRKFLVDSFEHCETADQRHEFLLNLARAATISDRIWNPESDQPELASVTTGSESLLCLGLLRASKHTVALGPLIRIYSLMRRGDVDAADVGQVLRAMTAFSTLWRGAYGGTNNIDTHYRSLMAEGLPGRGIAPFARMSEMQESAVNATTLKAYFRSVLDEAGMGSRDSWSKAASLTPIYKRSQPVARLLLLAANHDTVIDETQPGLPKTGNKGVMPLLNFEAWSDSGMLSVEHIAPQDQTEDWDQSIYANDDDIHRLGNLVLVPREENSALSNSSWEIKRACFKVLSATSPDAADAARVEAAEAGLELPHSIGTLDSDQPYRPLTASVAQVDADWSTSIIRERSVRLAELAWDQLDPWLR